MPETRRMIGVVVVDDNELLCQSIERWMTDATGVRCLASTGKVGEARKFVADLRPDVLLLDAEIPGEDTFALIRWVAGAHPSTKVLMLSGYLAEAYVSNALALGASGYVLKDESLPTIIESIKSAAKGELVLSKSVKPLLLGPA